jgi:hypothetical protein
MRHGGLSAATASALRESVGERRRAGPADGPIRLRSPPAAGWDLRFCSPRCSFFRASSDSRCNRPNRRDAVLAPCGEAKAAHLLVDAKTFAQVESLGMLDLEEFSAPVAAYRIVKLADS